MRKMKYISIGKIFSIISISLIGLVGCAQPKAIIPGQTQPVNPVRKTSNNDKSNSRSSYNDIMKLSNGVNIESINSETDVIGFMLKSRGLTRETARLDPQTLDALAASQAMIQPHFMRYWKNPWEFPKFVYSLTNGQIEVCEKPESIYEFFVISAVRTGRKVTSYISFAPVFNPKTNNPLLESLEQMYKRCNVPLSDKARAEINKAITPASPSGGAVPSEVQLLIAKFVYAAGEAKYYRDRALRHYPQDKWQEAFNFAVQAWIPNNESTEFEHGSIINWDLGQRLDYDDLYTGAVPNLMAIMSSEKFLSNPLCSEKTPEGQEPKKIDMSQLAFEFDTPLGKIAFNGKQEDNTYQGNDYLLIVDLGGNDTYKGATAASWKLEHPISTVIDWTGNDTYNSDEKTPCSQGAGILGYGFLIDNGGDDVFRAVDNAQGMSYFGVGILHDRGGNDTFEARYAAQGSASFGIANLIKKGGDDKYYCYYVGQGFGFVGGYGCLLDTGGNDRYVAEPYKVFRPVEGRQHDIFRNYSFCQGAGWGQRGDFSGGHSMAGGTGVLQDLAGNDHYEAGIYSQATGYWYGTGILHDKSGNDHYESSVFAQAGTAHMGLTTLLDESGDDTYHIWRANSHAAAHDVSVSWLIDKGGNDTISSWEWKDEKGRQTLSPTGIKNMGAGLLVGAAAVNSIAVYVNIGGNDTYELYSKDSLGWCEQRAKPGSWRYDNLNAALFIDIGGKDNYNLQGNPPDWPKAGNNLTWSRITPPCNPDKSFSMGLDTEKGRVPEAER